MLPFVGNNSVFFFAKELTSFARGSLKSILMRYCSSDAQFSIKEVDVGLAADLGSLHRVALTCGNMSWVRG